MRYAVGMYGGSFDPLHLGHVDCIIRAANQCAELYIVLSTGKNRREVPALVRYRWLYTLTKHIGNVHILMLEDTAETKAAYTRDFWMEDAEKVKKQIGKPIDVVFCGSDYGRDSFWNVCYPESELVIFPRSGISSTEIRRDLYGHWGWLPSVVRPYFVKKVLLIGTESTGKSVLTINLANRFATNYIEEAGRDISEHSGTDTLMLSSDFSEILLRQKIMEIEALGHSNRILFEDTDALVTLFFMGYLEDPDIRRNAALAEAISALNTYDLILFLEPDVPFVQDGDRRIESCSEREQATKQLKSMLEERGKTFHCLRGDYQEKYVQAVALTEALLQPAANEKRAAGCW